jgi:hypothetical protein
MNDLKVRGNNGFVCTLDIVVLIGFNNCDAVGDIII